MTIGKAMKTTEILDKYFNGDISVEDIPDILLKGKNKEDEHLEYKHSDELKKDEKNKLNPGQELRKYICGFANSDGGILVIGIDEKEHKVVNAKAPGGGDLAEWAVRNINHIAHLFSSPPIFRTVRHLDGDILIVIVNRSVNLIPVKEGDNLIYYVRFGDQTLRAEEYFITDILLGRRAFPVLEVSECRLMNEFVDELPKTHTVRDLNYYFQIRCLIENKSLILAEKVQIGLVCKMTSNSDRKIESQLLTYIDLEKDEIETINKISPIHRKASYNQNQELAPFESFYLSIDKIYIPFIRHPNGRYEYTWKAALYLISKNSPPIWYQLKLPMGNGPEVKDIKNKFEYSKLTNRRPVVSLKKLD
jgi:hypothetical protein